MHIIHYKHKIKDMAGFLVLGDQKNLITTEIHIFQLNSIYWLCKWMDEFLDSIMVLLSNMVHWCMVYGFVFFSLCQHANNDPVAESLYCNILRFFSSVFSFFRSRFLFSTTNHLPKNLFPFFIYRQKTIHMYTYLHRKHGDLIPFYSFLFHLFIFVVVRFESLSNLVSWIHYWLSFFMHTIWFVFLFI